MQQAGAGPDAIVGGDLVDLLEATDRNREATVLAGQVSQRSQRIERGNLVPTLGKHPRVSPRTTPGIKNPRPRDEPREEGVVQRGHVDANRARKELGSMDAVVVDGVGHRGISRELERLYRFCMPRRSDGLVLAQRKRSSLGLQDVLMHPTGDGLGCGHHLKVNPWVGAGF